MNTSPDSIRRWYAPVIAVGLLMAAGIFYERIDAERFQQTEKISIVNRLSTVRARMEGVINNNLLSINGLNAEISLNPEITQDTFSRHASIILSQTTEIRNIAAARDMVITHMYPMKGNEKALGLDYRKNKQQRTAALKAKEIGGIFVAGPVNLVQGGRGFIARAPIFEFARDKSHNRGRFWGLISTVIDVDKLYAASGLSDVHRGIEISIRGQDSMGAQGEVFFGRPGLFEEAPVLLDVSLPHGSWQLAATPRGGWTHEAPNAVAIRSAGVILLLLIIWLSYYREKQRKEKELVENALRKSEERYSILFNEMLDGFALHEMIFDDNGDPCNYRFIEANPAFEKITGLQRNKIIGKTVLEILPELEEHWIKDYGKVVQNGKPIHFENYLQELDKHFEVIAFRPREGQFAVSFTDVTERRKAELELKHTNQRMSLAADAAGIGIWDLDLVKNELIWDDWMFSIYGVKREEFGGAYEAWQQGVHPEDLERSSAEVNQAISGEKGFDTEFRIVLPSGGVRNIKANAIIIRDDEGKPLRMIGTNIDITERKKIENALRETEAQLEVAIESISDGFVLFDAEDRFVFANDAYINSHPVLKGTHLPGMKFEEIVRKMAAVGFYENVSEDIEKRVQLRLEHYRSGQPFEYRMENRHWYEMKEYKTREGGIALVRSDITERKEMEESLRRAHDQLEQRVEERTQELSREVAERKRAEEQANIANRTKSDLMANMSHELRTPLNAIIGFSDSMKEETFGPIGNDKYLEYLKDIHYSGQHLLELINDILDVSAIEAGALELHEGSVNLNDVFDVSARLIKPRAEAGKVSVTSSIDQKIPLICGDERRIKQVLLNLLSNAVKFTPECGEVCISAMVADDGSLVVAVIDNGIGMDQEEISLAMSSFGQVDSGLDRKNEGIGLGLPLTKGLMELHGGSMQINSEKGHGTSIMVTFPKERVIVETPQGN